VTKPNLGKQRTVAGAYSHDIGDRDSKRLVIGRRGVKVVRMRITAAGRQALSKLRWP
jgi:hypothetical protein